MKHRRLTCVSLRCACGDAVACARRRIFLCAGICCYVRFCLPKRPCRCLQAREITVILHSDNVSQNLCKKSNKKFSVGRYKWRKI